MDKLEILKQKMEVLKLMYDGSNMISKDWAMKNILGLDEKSNIRKHKINNILNGE